MICPKCGRELPDGSKFCSACGEKLTEINREVQEESEVHAESEVHEDPNTENESLSTILTTPVNTSNSNFVKFRKKPDRKKIIIIAVAAVALVAALFGLKNVFSFSGSNNAFVYSSNGKYELITNLNKDQTIEIASSKSDITANGLVSFSPDGKYVYFYTKYDSYSGNGTLCRAEYGKLKADSSKNEKYIEIIDTNVALGLRFLDDGSVIYENSERTLYYFNGKEPIQIAKNINYYFTDGSEKIVYVTGDDSAGGGPEGYTLSGVSLSDIDNKIVFASDIGYVHDANDFENILFTKYEDDESDTLYVVGFNRELEKLAENVKHLTEIEGKTYFTAGNNAMLNLYDFVDDTYADSDAGIKEPDPEDFSVPYYSYDMITGSDLSESDFDELYTSCTKALYWYGENYGAYSMEEALEVDWGDNSEELYAVTKNFIDKYSDSADENGYILVTDEVKAALKEIQKHADYPEREWQWMWLCYNKRQSGTTTDYDSYNAARDKWNGAKKRISIREALQDKENAYLTQTLYCFEKGTLTPLHENVLDVDIFTGGIVFNTTDLVTETIKIDDVTSVNDVKSLFEINKKDENHIILTDGTLCRMSASSAGAFAEAYDKSYASLVFTSKEVYMLEENGALSMATINGGVVGDFSIVTDDAVILDVDGPTLYYANGSYQNNGFDYYNIYSINNGVSTCMAKDVMLYDINLFNDGKVLAYTGYKNNSGYELTMFDSKGESTFISDNVTQYIRVDKSTMLYISDDNLYFYNGKEKQLVKNGVEWIWSKNTMETDKTLNWDS